MENPGILPETIEFLTTWRYDRMIEKHEGPEDWVATFHWGGAGVFEYEGVRLLLPQIPDRIPNISVLRWFPSADGTTITVFLKDTSLAEYFPADDQWYWAGFVAICELVPTEPLYVATFYHEWYMVDNQHPDPKTVEYLRNYAKERST